MSEQKKKLVAYHEAGHAILGALMRPWLEWELSSPQAKHLPSYFFVVWKCQERLRCCGEDQHRPARASWWGHHLHAI